MVYSDGRCVQPLRASGPLESSSGAKVQMRFSDHPLAFLRGNELGAGGLSVCCHPLWLIRSLEVTRYTMPDTTVV